MYVSVAGTSWNQYLQSLVHSQRPCHGGGWELLASAQPLGDLPLATVHLGSLLKRVEGVCRDPELSHSLRKSRLWSQGAVAHWGGAR